MHTKTKEGIFQNPFRLVGNPKQGLLGATLGFFIGFTAVSLFGPSAKLFKDITNLTPTMVGLLVAMPNLSGSILRIPFSAMVDITGGRKPFLILLILSTAGMLGLYLVVDSFYPHSMSADLYPLLLFLGALSGCGVATFSVGIGQTSYWFPQSQQGSALGTYAGVGNIAPGLFTFLFPIALLYFGLSGTYFAWLIFLFTGTIIYYLIGKNSWYFQLLGQGVDRGEARSISSTQYGQDLFPKGKFKDSLLISARTWKTWALILVYFTTFGGFLALTVWLPTYWQMFHSLTISTSTGLTALYTILASIIRIIGGRMSDKLGGEKTATLSLSTMLAGTLIMVFSHDVGLSIFGTILMAIGMGITNAAVFKLVPQSIPKAVGGASGWVGGLGAFGGFLITIMMTGFVKTESLGDLGYAQGFIIFTGLALLSIGVISLLKHTRRA